MPAERESSSLSAAAPGAAPLKALFEVVAGPLAQPTTRARATGAGGLARSTVAAPPKFPTANETRPARRRVRAPKRIRDRVRRPAAEVGGRQHARPRRPRLRRRRLPGGHGGHRHTVRHPDHRPPPTGHLGGAARRQDGHAQAAGQRLDDHHDHATGETLCEQHWIATTRWTTAEIRPRPWSGSITKGGRPSPRITRFGTRCSTDCGSAAGTVGPAHRSCGRPWRTPWNPARVSTRIAPRYTSPITCALTVAAACLCRSGPVSGPG